MATVVTTLQGSNGDSQASAVSGGLVAGANASTRAVMTREASEVLAQVQMAKSFPRNEIQSRDRVLNACMRPRLAEVACYNYTRGSTEVRGPSIRLAEALAQNWGNITFGVREVEQRQGSSTCEAFAWDMETNTRKVVSFQVPHIRYSRRNGNTVLTDPRDIYEMVANQGARRLRSCILQVIPADIIEEAMEQCEQTLVTFVQLDAKRIASMVDRFKELGVSKEQLEARLQRHTDAITSAQFLSLGRIYNSLKDGMGTIEDFFPSAEEVSSSTKKTAKPKRAQDAYQMKPKEVENKVEDTQAQPEEAKTAQAKVEETPQKEETVHVAQMDF